MRDGDDLRDPPPWLARGTVAAMRLAQDQALAWGRDAYAAAEAVREVVAAAHPALPATMITEAVACIVPDAQGLTRHVPDPAEEPLDRATPQEVVETLSYALRFGSDGRPRRTGHDFMAPLAAAQLVAHLERSRFVVMRRPPLKPHGGR